MQNEQVSFMYLRMYVHTYIHKYVAAINKEDMNFKRVERSIWDSLDGGKGLGK